MKVNILNLSKKTDTLEEDIDNILLKFYPIGSIYLSISDINPGETFGGTWESWGSGRVPVGVDTSQTEFNTVEKIGGEKTHKLSLDEMPKHTHTIPSHMHSLNSHTHSFSATTNSSGNHYHIVGSVKTGTSGNSQVRISSENTSTADYATSTTGAHTHTISGTTGKASGNTGSSSVLISGSNGDNYSHNNLPPYITCYMWLRIA